MDEQIIVAIDVGTSKICTLVGRIEENDQVKVLGVGIEPTKGIRKGNIVDLNAASKSIIQSINKAERTSGVEINSAIVSLAGSHVASKNNRGVVGVSGRTIDTGDITRALDAARAVSIPHNREIIHVIQRAFMVDDQDGIRLPIGMHGYRLEVEAHIISASAATAENLRQCVAEAGVDVARFVLNPLAAAEVVLSETEREMGVVVCDIGGGTTDLAIYIDGTIWHSMVRGVGGDHITSDIAHGLRLPTNQAEEVKVKYGHAQKDMIADDDFFNIKPFGEEQVRQVSRKDLALIIQARVEEMFGLVLQEIKRSGYDGLLPAGLVLTGGTAQLPEIKDLASEVLGLPVRIGVPEGMTGMTDLITSPAYSTSLGLLFWSLNIGEMSKKYDTKSIREKGGGVKEKISTFIKKLVP